VTRLRVGFEDGDLARKFIDAAADHWDDARSFWARLRDQRI
jgi:hypothetical protein